jgi:hypothetical protein
VVVPGDRLPVGGLGVDLVDHHGVDVAVLSDAGQHRPQGRSVGTEGRLTPVDVLVGERPAGVADVTGAGFTLGRDRQALLPLALLGLLAGGHPQVDHTRLLAHPESRVRAGGGRSSKTVFYETTMDRNPRVGR